MNRQVVVIPDLHGRPDLLDATLAQFPDAYFIGLGDAIDRGPRSMKTVEKLMALHRDGRATLLMGNHERMASEGLRWYRQYLGTHDMGDYRRAIEGFRNWMRAGGETVRSELGTLTLEKFPPLLDEYFQALERVVYVTGDGQIHTSPPGAPSVLLAHASPPVRHQQYPDPFTAALWLRPFEGPFPMPEGVVYSVHGHTPSPLPTRMGRHLYLDLGAYETGRLALAELTLQGLPRVTVLCGRGNPSLGSKYPRFGEPVPVQAVDLPGAPPR